jgi:cytochrome c
MAGRRLFAAIAGALVFASGLSAQRAGGPNLGRPATADEIRRVDLSIPPDGTGLPPGSGTAKAGAATYASRCASCHGEKGEGKTNDRLVGGMGTLKSSQPPVKTVGSYWQWATTLFDYTRRAMPYGAPLSLSDDEVYAVTAYLLFQNGIVGEDEVLDAQSLPRVKMPNRDNFVNAYSERPK